MSLVKEVFYFAEDVQPINCYVAIEEQQDGEQKYWFQAKEFTSRLDYKDVNSATFSIPEKFKRSWKELKDKINCEFTPLNFQSNTMFISEPGLFYLIFHSKKTEAVQFANYVYEDVLPTLRKKGFYAINQQLMAQIEELNTTNQSLTQQLEMSKMTEEEEKQKNQNLNIQLSKSMLMINEINQNNKELADKISYFNITIENSKQKTEKLESELVIANSEANRGKMNIAKLESELLIAKSEATERKQITLNLESELVIANSEANQSKISILNLKSELEIAKNELELENIQKQSLQNQLTFSKQTLTTVAPDLASKPKREQLQHLLYVHKLPDNRYIFTRCQKRNKSTALGKIQRRRGTQVFKKDYLPNGINVLNCLKELLYAKQIEYISKDNTIDVDVESDRMKEMITVIVDDYKKFIPN